MTNYLRNLPIPEPFILALPVGLLLHILAPSALLPSFREQAVLGLAMVMLALALTAWSLVAVGRTHLAQPSQLVTAGPYRFSRNPMYLSWTGLAGGLAVLLNSLWIILAGLAAWVYLQLVSIPAEERSLEKMFGPAYDEYRRHVRRWL